MPDISCEQEKYLFFFSELVFLILIEEKNASD